MSYRDDLAAALARIDALERQLAGSVTGDMQTAELRTRNQHLEGEIERLNNEQRAMVREIESLSQKLYGPRPSVEVTKMTALPHHNRQYPSRPRGSPAGVLCPCCIEIGERVQMERSSWGTFAERNPDLASVICPTCATIGLLRRS